MNVTIEVTIPPKTTEQFPVNIVRSIPVGGICSSVSVRIPDGHRGLARLRINSRGAQLVPSIGSDPRWIRGDNTTLEFRPEKTLEGPEWLLEFIGWSEDQTFPHTFFVNIQME